MLGVSVCVCARHILTTYSKEKLCIIYIGIHWIYLYLSVLVFSALSLKFHESAESGRLSVWAEKGLCQHGLQVIWWPQDDAQALANQPQWISYQSRVLKLLLLSLMLYFVWSLHEQNWNWPNFKIMTMNKKDPPSWLAILCIQSRRTSHWVPQTLTLAPWQVPWTKQHPVKVASWTWWHHVESQSRRSSDCTKRFISCAVKVYSKVWDEFVSWIVIFMADNPWCKTTNPDFQCCSREVCCWLWSFLCNM